MDIEFATFLGDWSEHFVDYQKFLELSDDKMAETLGLSAEIIRQYQTGKTRVPKLVSQFLINLVYQRGLLAGIDSREKLIK